MVSRATLAFVLLSASSVLAQTCPTIDLDSTGTYMLSVVASDGTQQTDTKSGNTGVAGDWTATKAIGAPSNVNGESRFTLAQEARRVTATLRTQAHAARTSGPTVTGDVTGTIDLRLKLTGGNPTNTVIVHLYRSVKPGAGESGFGVCRVERDVNDPAWAEVDRLVYSVPANGSVPAIPLSAEAHVSQSGTTNGSMDAAMMAVAEVEGCPGPIPPVPDFSDLENDYTNPDDDQPPPCSGSPSGGNTGPPPSDCPPIHTTLGGGLHVRFSTGNVYTRVPVFTAYSAEGKDLECVLRYDSLRRNKDVGLGLGWTHALDIRIEEVNGKVVLHQGNGRRVSFTPFTQGSTTGYLPPLGVYAALLYNGTQYEIVQPDGTRYLFDSVTRRVYQIIDRRGRTTNFEYVVVAGGATRVSRVVSPHGCVALFGYNATTGRLESITDPAGKVTTLGYASSGSDYVLTSVTDPLMPQHGVVTYEYNDATRPGAITKEILKNGNEFRCAYGESSRTLTDKNNATIGTVTAAGVFPEVNGTAILAGTVTHVDGRSNSWTITRNTVGQVTQVQTPESRTWTYNWGPIGSNYGANRITSIVDPRGFTRQYSYNAGGRVSSATEQVAITPSPVYVTTTYDYDSELRGILKHITEPDGDVWDYTLAQSDGPTNTYKKGDLQVITDPLLETPTDGIVSFTYETWADTDGTLPWGISALPGRIKKLTVTDRRGYNTVYEYATNGTLTKKTIDPSPGLNLITDYTSYDAMGRLLQQSVQRSPTDTVVTDYTYDEMGRRLTMKVYPATGVTLTTTYGYDRHGLLKDVTNPRSVKTSFGYDVRNRRTSLIENDGGAGGTGGVLTTTYEYDANDNLLRTVDPRGNDTEYSYDGENQPYVMTDAEDFRTIWLRDGVNVLQQKRERTVSQSDWEVQEWDYDGLSRVTKHRTFTGTGDSPTGPLETQLEYTTAGGCGCAATPGRALVFKITDPAGKISYRKYDELDRLVKIIRKVTDASETEDGDDAVTSFEYDATGNLTLTTGPDAQKLSNVYDAANRRTSQTADPNGAALVTALTYDGAFNLTGGTLPNGDVITLTYDNANRLTNSSDSIGALFTIAYDGNDNVTTRADGLGNTWQYTYDNHDRATVIKDPIVESGTDKVENLYYDNNSNLVERFDRNGRLTRYAFDKLDRQTEMVEDAVPTVPGDGDGDGDVDEADQALFANCYGVLPISQQCQIFDFDQDGDIDKADQAAMDEAYTGQLSLVYLKRKTATTYDGLSRVKTLTAWTANAPDPGQTEVTTYAYDGAGRMTQLKYPDDNIPAGSSGIVAYAYHPSGRVWQRTDQKNVVTTYTYDDLHRLTNRDFADATPDDTFGYDKSGRLTNANNSVANLTFTYDAVDRLFSAAQAMGGSTLTTSLGYSVTPSVNQRTVTYPGSTAVVENYDKRDRMTSITAGGTFIYSASTYDLADRMLTRTSGPGGVSTYTYDSDDRLTSVDHKNGSAAILAKLAYGYDAVGNRKYREDLTPNLSSWSEVYTYDGLHRLRDFKRGTLNAAKTDVATPVTAPFTYLQEWVEFDLLGNWLNTRKRVNTTPTPTSTTDVRTINNVNEYLTQQINGGTTTSLTSDNTGNLTDDGTQTYVDDAENRLIEVWRKGTPNVLVQTYQYDALGRRVKTLDNCPAGCTGGICPNPNPSGSTVETWHIYADGPACIQEYKLTPSATLQRYFVHGAGCRHPLPCGERAG